MTEEIRTQYKAKEILESIPSDRGELIIGYRPVTKHGKWQEQFHQTLERQPGRSLSRSVFGIPGNKKGGIVVEVVECASAQEAVEELMDTLADSQAAALDPAHESLLPAAFRLPKQVPDALFFYRANLRISIISQSRDYSGVDEWLDLIHKDLDQAPDEGREGLEIRSGDNSGRLYYKFPWKVGSQGWFKFKSKGVPIEKGKKSGELVIGPTETEVTVKGWVLERDRETYLGDYKRSGVK